MKRRSLLKLAGLAGLSTFLSGGLKRAGAAPLAYEGPFFITFQAGWGWDPTLFCDPKGAPINAGYDPSAITSTGAIRYAPFSWNKAFFSTHASRLCVINGIQLAAHQPVAGARHVWAGTPQPGYPSIGALLAAALGEDLPMAFLGSGGFEATAGVVPRSTLSGSSPDDWTSITDGGPDSQPLFTPATETRILQYRRERLAARLKAASLPPVQRALLAAQRAEMSRSDVARWTQAFPSWFSADDTRALFQLILSAFKAGVAVSANLSFSVAGGQFDEWQIDNFKDWLQKLDILFDEIDAFDLRKSIIVAAGSHGGRTPMYLEDKMKGEWSVTSMLLSGPGIPGNRVIGQTDADLRSVPIDPQSLKPDPAGIRLSPAHIHRALRALAGVRGSPLDERFPLSAEDLPLFG